MIQASDATNHRSDEFLTVRETAELLKFTPSTIRELVHADEIPWVRVGRSIRIPRAELLASLAAKPIVTRVEES